MQHRAPTGQPQVILGPSVRFAWRSDREGCLAGGPLAAAVRRLLCDQAVDLLGLLGASKPV